MNNLLYARLAKTNLSKNRQNILPYLLSCIGTVVMFFIMDTLAQGSGFDSMIGKDTILTVMGMGTYIIGLFAVIFLIYSNSFLAKRRKKEFGLFQILGMEKKHLAKILFFESLYLWAASLGIGILLGVLLYRLLFLVLMKRTERNNWFCVQCKSRGKYDAAVRPDFCDQFSLKPSPDPRLTAGRTAARRRAG